MRKIVVLLLMIGIVLGAVSLLEGVNEKSSPAGDTQTLHDIVEEGGNNPVPCGEGRGGGGGAPG